MSTLEELDQTGVFKLETPAVDEKTFTGIYPDEEKLQDSAQWTPPEDWLERLKDEYSGRHERESLPPGCDPDRFAVAILTMNEEQAVECLNDIIENLHNDFTFDRAQAARMKELASGNQTCGLDYSEWAYQVCKMAGILHNWSAYLEVRACTLPYDDVNEPCESLRAYLVGFFWVIVITAVNTCECGNSPEPISRFKLTSLSLCSSTARYLDSESSRSITMCAYGSRSGGDPAEVERHSCRPSFRTQPGDAMECQRAAFYHHYLLRCLINR